MIRNLLQFNRVHYEWNVLLASTIVMSAASLAAYTFGVFIIPLMLEFGWDRGPLSIVPSMACIVSSCFVIFAGRKSDKHGPRIVVTLGGIMLGAGFLLMSQIKTLTHAYIFWGLCMGLAMSCMMTPLYSTVPRWFTQKRGLALGILNAGVGIGAIISPILAQLLISKYDWKNAFLILGIVAWAIAIPLTQVIKHSPSQTGLRSYGETENLENKMTENLEKGYSLIETMRTFQFWCFACIQFLWFFCLQIILVHIVPHATDIGIKGMASASILSAIASCSILGRLLVGLMADKINSRRALNICLILAVMALIYLVFAKEIWAFYLFALVFGFAFGGVMPLTTMIPAELFGVKSLGVILGTLMVFGTIGGAAGPPIAGYIFDMTGSYRAILMTIAAISSLAAILGVVLLKK